MSDKHTAKALQIVARHHHDVSINALDRARGYRTITGLKILAEAAYYSLLALTYLDNSDRDFDDDKKSLVELARRISSSGIREFEMSEIELLAVLDTVHMRPVSAALLPEEYGDQYYGRAQPFVDRLVRELYDLVK